VVAFGSTSAGAAAVNVGGGVQYQLAADGRHLSIFSRTFVTRWLVAAELHLLSKVAAWARCMCSLHQYVRHIDNT
jgi:hypothetical protein